MIKYVVEIKHDYSKGRIDHIVDGHWDIRDEVFDEVHGLVLEEDHVWLKGHARYFKDGRVERDGSNK